MVDNPVRLAFIIPYFTGGGKLPNFFECFLHTVKYNLDYTWILYTDSERDYDYPSNMIINHCSFEQIKALFQSKFDFPISLPSPQKLCDYKPAYGFIFSDTLKGYDYWGYCDIDEYYGSLSKWLNPEFLQKYDRLFSLGHMSIYKNSYEINKLFMNTLQNAEGKRITSYKQIFISDKHYAFDEWKTDCVTINSICEESGVSVCWDWPLADIGPFCSSFKESVYSREVHNWVDDRDSPCCIIIFSRGELFLFWEQDGGVLSKEVLYAHLQKRRFDISQFDPNCEYFAIVPNRIISSKKMFTEKEIRLFLKKSRIRQWFQVDENTHRYNNLIKWLKYQICKRIWNYNAHKDTT